MNESPWISGRVRNGYWNVREHRVRYFDWLAGRCGFHEPVDWYELRRFHFSRTGGAGLLYNFYKCSVRTAVADYLPDYDWKPWLFRSAPNGFWKHKKNRHAFMQWLARELAIQQPADWYQVTAADFHAHHGGGLLNNEFKGSVQAVLAEFDPEFDWKPWLFCSVPRSFWQCVDNRRRYLRWLGRQIGFRKTDDWANLQRKHFVTHGGTGLLEKYYGGSAQRAVAEMCSECPGTDRS
jgi:hypothetical protein